MTDYGNVLGALVVSAAKTYSDRVAINAADRTVAPAPVVAKQVVKPVAAKPRLTGTELYSKSITDARNARHLEQLSLLGK